MNPSKLAVWTVTPVIALTLAGGFFPASAQNQPGRRGDPPRGPQSIERMAERLDLTAEQQAKIEALREQGEAERLEHRKQMMRLRHEMQGEWLKDEPSESTLKSLARQIGELRNQMQIRRIEHRLALREVLTDEQWDKLLTSRGGPGRGHQGFGPKGRGNGNPEAGNWRDR